MSDKSLGWSDIMSDHVNKIIILTVHVHVTAHLRMTGMMSCRLTYMCKDAVKMKWNTSLLSLHLWCHWLNCWTVILLFGKLWTCSQILVYRKSKRTMCTMRVSWILKENITIKRISDTTGKIHTVSILPVENASFTRQRTTCVPLNRLLKCGLFTISSFDLYIFFVKLCVGLPFVKVLSGFPQGSLIVSYWSTLCLMKAALGSPALITKAV